MAAPDIPIAVENFLSDMFANKAQVPITPPIKPIITGVIDWIISGVIFINWLVFSPISSVGKYVFHSPSDNPVAFPFTDVGTLPQPASSPMSTHTCFNKSKL